MCKLEFFHLNSVKFRVTSYTDSCFHIKAAKTITSDQNIKAFSLDTSSTNRTFVNHNCNVTAVLGLYI